MIFTDKQRDAISFRNKDILVSAAAGSGKTSVLSERVAELIIEGADIRRMLICTFTNAAAAEMKERIIKRLSSVAKGNNSLRLFEQSEYAAFSDICTIHSFSQRIIKENAMIAESLENKVAIPGRLRVLNKDEVDIIKQRAMNDCFEQFYETEDADFIKLRKKYSGRKEDDLKNILFNIYDFANSLPEKLEWLKNASQTGFVYKDSFKEQRKLGANKIVSLLELCIKEGYSATDEYSKDELEESQNALTKWQKQILNDETDYELAKRLLDSATDDEASEKLYPAYKLTALTRNLPKDVYREKVDAYHKEISKTLKEIQSFIPNDRSLEYENTYIKSETASFYKVLKAFDGLYMQYKLAKKGMNFDDMIYYANEILKNDEIAEEYKKRYDYVFIDEYQDTNPIQEELLNRVSKTGGRFMVGDMKQSIYRFRLADPMIFKKKADRFSGNVSESETLVHMNENFRSTPQVCNGINHIMRRLMSKDLGEIDYTKDEELIPSRKDKGFFELLITNDADTHSTSEFESIARRILELKGTELCGRILDWKDFCILIRSGIDSTAALISNVFNRYGIPIIYNRTQEELSYLFVFLNILSICDGFYSDTALISVMRSHIGLFTDVELTQIRTTSPKTSFAEAFTRCCNGTDSIAEKCRSFMHRIETWRVYMQALSMADFLAYIKTDTNFDAACEAIPGGENTAPRFTQFFTALIDMLKTVRSIPELVESVIKTYNATGNLPGIEDKSEKPNAVNLMTIHASKGLQFPVVILARTQRMFNSRDLEQQAIWHKNMGFTFDYIDENAHTREATKSKELMKQIILNESKSEEMRVLYVAMTRAEDGLIISGISKFDGEDRLEALKTGFSSDMIHPYSLMKKPNQLSWVICGLADLSSFGGDKTDAEVKIRFEEPRESIETVSEITNRKIEEIITTAYGKPSRDFIKYEHKEIPSWVGVTWLLPEYTPDEGDFSDSENYSGKPKIASTALGTLVHLFLELAPFSIKDKIGVEEFINEMQKKEIINEAEYKELIRSSKYIANFYTSELMDRIRNAKNVYKELPFCVDVDSGELGYESGEKTLVGGVIDLIFEEEDGLVIVDYKSNHASPDTVTTLAEHYHKQMEMYSYATREIWDMPIKEKYLFFLRPGIALKLD